jgi:hypothetical protein
MPRRRPKPNRPIAQRDRLRLLYLRRRLGGVLAAQIRDAEVHFALASRIADQAPGRRTSWLKDHAHRVLDALQDVRDVLLAVGGGA